VTHSEFNHSSTERVHFLQIWITPNVTGITPSYEEKHFDVASKTEQLRLIAAPDGSDGSVLIHQDARIYASILNSTTLLTHPLSAGRTGYVHVIRGQVEVNGIQLTTGDALKIQAEAVMTFTNAVEAELLMFDLPY
jgi:hypothetical protein